MPTKKGGAGRPPPKQVSGPAPPPTPKRPQLRPIGGVKPPLLRPLNAHTPSAPRYSTGAKPPTSDKPPATLKVTTPAPFEDEATSVMQRPTFESARLLPPQDNPPPEEIRARPARPIIDIVPPTERAAAERTVVMANAPQRPTHHRPLAGEGPQIVHASSTHSSGALHSRAPVPSVPPLDDLLPNKSNRPPSPWPSARSGPSSSSPTSVAPPPPQTIPLPIVTSRDQTVTLDRHPHTSSAPVSFPPAYAPGQKTHGERATERSDQRVDAIAERSNRRVDPIAEQSERRVDQTGSIPHPPTSPPPQLGPAVITASASSPLGLVLFAAPLALATAAVAALALL